MKMQVLIRPLFQTLCEYAHLRAHTHALRHENIVQQLE